MAEYLQGNIADTKNFNSVIMVITSIVAGVFSAGPAAGAMMPVITGDPQRPPVRQKIGSLWLGTAGP